MSGRCFAEFTIVKASLSMKPLWMVGLLVVLPITTTGCGKGAANVRELIVGKWQHAGNANETIEVSKDGALTIADSAAKLPPIQAQYRFIDDSHIELTITEA